MIVALLDDVPSLDVLSGTFALEAAVRGRCMGTDCRGTIGCRADGCAAPIDLCRRVHTGAAALSTAAILASHSIRAPPANV